jgi:cytidyltransferase-like protein
MAVGIVCEFNPLHNGHLYLINKVKEMYDEDIIVILGGNFLERGNLSIIEKYDKALLALNHNVSLVVELPFGFATSSSDIFAKGALKLLNELKVDKIVFGSEEGKLDNLEKCARTQIENKEYDSLVKKYMDQGENYPTSMNKALKELVGLEITKPNDLLGLSYIKEIIKNNYNIEVINIKRTTSYHGEEIHNNITSASNIRKLYLEAKDISNLIPYNKKILYKISMNKYFNYLKYKIITEGISLNKYQTVDEGIENRITKIISTTNSWKELVEKIKTKRYTYNKINRMLIHILTNFTKKEAKNIKIDYIRILGFNQKGKSYLNSIKKELNIPIITNYKPNFSKLLDLEFRITKIYSLVTNDNILELEYKNKPIIKE